MAKRKTSPIWQPSTEEFKTIVAKAKTYTELLKHFGLKNRGGNHRTVKKRIAEEHIDTTHFLNRYQLGIQQAKPLSTRLVKGSTYNKGLLKQRLIEEQLLLNVCSECGTSTEWNGKPLVLELDHINGDSTDDRLENLRLLCPNCHSQTSTFRGRNNRKTYQCMDCGVTIYKQTKRCRQCAAKAANFKKRKVKDRPAKEILLQEINEMGYCATGRKYGVSDNTIRKWLKSS